MSIAPAERVETSLEEIAALDFEPEWKCEHKSHGTGSYWSFVHADGGEKLYRITCPRGGCIIVATRCAAFISTLSIYAPRCPTCGDSLGPDNYIPLGTP